MTTLEKIRAEIEQIADEEQKHDEKWAMGLRYAVKILDKYAEQEPISVSVSEKEPDEISEEVTLRFFRNSLKVRWQDMVIYNVEWLKKNWQMEMDIVCGVKPCDDAVSRQAVLEMAYDMSEIDGEHFTEPCMVVDVEDIRKLPSIRPQSCDDAISREAVLNLIRGCNSALEEPKIFDCHNAGVKFEQYITELPTVRPQEQTGKWKFVCQHWRKCSECGFSHKFAEDWEYCPNCGARMNEDNSN